VGGYHKGVINETINRSFIGSSSIGASAERMEYVSNQTKDEEITSQISSTILTSLV
jgi:hypothetical protein